MSIFNNKSKNKHYVVINSEPIVSSSLSFKAKGILAYLLSLPEDWEVNLKQIEKLSPNEGRESIRNGIKELIEHKYIIRTQYREGGKFIYKYDVYDCPTTDDGSPLTANRSRSTVDGEPLTVSRQHTNDSLLMIQDKRSFNKDQVSQTGKNSENFDKAGDFENQLIKDVLKDSRLSRFFEQEGYSRSKDTVTIIKQFLRWLEDKFSSSPNIRSPIAVAITTVRNIETENHHWLEFIADRTEMNDLLNDPEILKMYSQEK